MPIKSILMSNLPLTIPRGQLTKQRVFGMWDDTKEPSRNSYRHGLKCILVTEHKVENEPCSLNLWYINIKLTDVQLCSNL